VNPQIDDPAWPNCLETGVTPTLGRGD
jgi:hypothetical protein